MIFPQAPGLWFQEGILLLARGDLAGSRQCFEAVLRLPDQCNYFGVDANLDSRARHNLAFVLRQLGLPAEAEAHWQVTIGQTPEFEPAWLALLELLLEHDRRADAEALLLKLEGKVYRDAIWPGIAARLMLARGDVGGACRILEEAVSKTPNALWLRTLLADILLCATTDLRRGEHHLRQILALAPNELQTRRKLAALMANKTGSSSPAPVVSTSGSPGLPVPSPVGHELSGPAARISLCMIAKNEERNLGPCLRSVEGLIDDIVVVDTGPRIERENRNPPRSAAFRFCLGG